MSETHVHALPAGHRIGEYEIVRVLGAGGFGITYLAFDHHLNGPVAIKEYFPAGFAVRIGNQRLWWKSWVDYLTWSFEVRTGSPRVVASSPENRATYAWGLDRFIREARAVHQFRHPNVVRVYRFVEADGTAYIVMEYVEGESLAASLDSRGPLSAAEWQPLLDRLLDGLAHVHGQGYLHRDIKPGNIVIRTADGEPVVIDFGAARIAAGELTHTRVLTPQYAPIEQHSSRAEQGPWTDIYSLAAVSYRVLTGEAPPSAPERMLDDQYAPLVQRLTGTGADWLAAIDNGLALRPEDRPQTVAAWRALMADTASCAAAARQGDASALARLRRAADLGSALAQERLGNLYRHGEGVEQDLREAEAWLRRAAEQGLADAQLDLGSMYYVGSGVGQDLRAAAAWVRRAAQQEHPIAQWVLGWMYQCGRGVDLDYIKAVSWYRKAAERNDRHGQYRLGSVYENGWGVTRDFSEAAAWYTKAARSGEVNAQYASASCTTSAEVLRRMTRRRWSGSAGPPGRVMRTRSTTSASLAAPERYCAGLLEGGGVVPTGR